MRVMNVVGVTKGGGQEYRVIYTSRLTNEWGSSDGITKCGSKKASLKLPVTKAAPQGEYLKQWPLGR